MKLTATARALIIIIVLAILGGAGYYFAKSRGLVTGGVIKDTEANVSDYSAVFLTNGQVYFGKIEAVTDKEVSLKSIYYLQVDQQDNLQNGNNKNATTTTDNSNISLVKLGNELHGPNDRMHINRDQVLFTESLKNDSKVVDAIKNYSSKQ